LDEGGTYYWSVDQVRESDTIPGKIWTFRAAGPVPGRPFVAISSPASDTIIPNTDDVYLEAEAWDTNGSITSVEFFEGYESLGIDSVAPYSILWDNIEIGTHVIIARATDNERQKTFSEEISFQYQDIIPSATVTSPEYGARFNAPASITITAEASDVDGSVTLVEFYNGVSLLGSDDSPPYSFTWENVTPGKYYLKAKVTDDDAQSSFSPVVYVTVQEVTSLENKNEENVSLFLDSESEALELTLGEQFAPTSRLSILNLQGKVILKKILYGHQHKLDVSGLPQGIYLINLENEHENFVGKFYKN
jgi:hypothetical protein